VEEIDSLQGVIFRQKNRAPLQHGIITRHHYRSPEP
jgi:hypothetical protein